MGGPVSSRTFKYCPCEMISTLRFHALKMPVEVRINLSASQTNRSQEQLDDSNARKNGGYSFLGLFPTTNRECVAKPQVPTATKQQAITARPCTARPRSQAGGIGGADVVGWLQGGVPHQPHGWGSSGSFGVQDADYE